MTTPVQTVSIDAEELQELRRLADEGRRLRGDIDRKMAESVAKFWDNLARYKFLMAGYCGANWVILNALGDRQQPNPFTQLVQFARATPFFKPFPAKAEAHEVAA